MRVMLLNKAHRFVISFPAPILKVVQVCQFLRGVSPQLHILVEECQDGTAKVTRFGTPKVTEVDPSDGYNPYQDRVFVTDLFTAQAGKWVGTQENEFRGMWHEVFDTGCESALEPERAADWCTKVLSAQAGAEKSNSLEGF